MSKLEVDAIEPQSGTTLTIGASGDTITIPSGATFDASSGSLSGTLTTAAQPNITSVGTLTSFTSTGIDDNATSTAITIDSSERVLINQTSTISGGGVTGSLQLSGTNFNNSSASFSNFGNDANPSILMFNKSRSGVVGTTGTIVQNGDVVGNINWNADDGTDLGSNLARISGAIDGVPGVNDTPGRLVFYTTSDGNSAVTERMRIDSSGNVGIGTTSPSEKLHVNGNIQNQYGVTQPLYLKASSTGNTTGVITITPIFNQSGIIHINSFHNSYIPFYGRGGSGVSFTIFWGDIDTGFTTSSSFSYTESGSNANTYTLSMAGNNGQLSIERTSGSETYNVYVYKWSI